MQDALTIIQNLIPTRVPFFVVTLFGSMVMYIFALIKEFKGAEVFLKRFFPGHSQVFYDRLDFFVVVISGAIIGNIFFRPTDYLQALSAGFGWVAAVNILLESKKAIGGSEAEESKKTIGEGKE